MIAVIGDKDTVVGFALSGVKNGRVAENKKEAEDALKEFMETPNMHVIIITEKAADLIRKEVGTWKKQKKIYPVIVEVPDKKGGMKRDDPIEKLISRAIGVIPGELRG